MRTLIGQVAADPSKLCSTRAQRAGRLRAGVWRAASTPAGNVLRERAGRGTSLTPPKSRGGVVYESPTYRSRLAQGLLKARSSNRRCWRSGGGGNWRDRPDSPNVAASASRGVRVRRRRWRPRPLGFATPSSVPRRARTPGRPPSVRRAGARLRPSRRARRCTRSGSRSRGISTQAVDFRGARCESAVRAPPQWPGMGQCPRSRRYCDSGGTLRPRPAWSRSGNRGDATYDSERTREATANVYRVWRLQTSDESHAGRHHLRAAALSSVAPIFPILGLLASSFVGVFARQIHALRRCDGDR
jgi:hypothetical protein